MLIMRGALNKGAPTNPYELGSCYVTWAQPPQQGDVTRLPCGPQGLLLNNS